MTSEGQLHNNLNKLWQSEYNLCYYAPVSDIKMSVLQIFEQTMVNEDN
jgi:hypothetical protein